MDLGGLRSWDVYGHFKPTNLEGLQTWNVCGLGRSTNLGGPWTWDVFGFGPWRSSDLGGLQICEVFWSLEVSVPERLADLRGLCT